MPNGWNATTPSALLQGEPPPANVKLQADSFSEALTTLEATRAEQQSMELLLSERDEEIAALRAAAEARTISEQQAARQLIELSPRQPAVRPPPPPQTPQYLLGIGPNPTPQYSYSFDGIGLFPPVSSPNPPVSDATHVPSYLQTGNP
eukprot:2570089-Amphidinium_carterae.2